MEIRIIEKAKGMNKKGATDLLKYHQELQRAKIRRLMRQIEETEKVLDRMQDEIERREERIDE